MRARMTKRKIKRREISPQLFDVLNDLWESAYQYVSKIESNIEFLKISAYNRDVDDVLDWICETSSDIENMERQIDGVCLLESLKIKSGCVQGDGEKTE